MRQLLPLTTLINKYVLPVVTICQLSYVINSFNSYFIYNVPTVFKNMLARSYHTPQSECLSVCLTVYKIQYRYQFELFTIFLYITKFFVAFKSNTRRIQSYHKFVEKTKLRTSTIKNKHLDNLQQTASMFSVKSLKQKRNPSPSFAPSLSLSLSLCETNQIKISYFIQIKQMHV